MIIEYRGILIMMIVGVLISVIVMIASEGISGRRGESEKLTAYECGFEGFMDSRGKMEIKYYEIGILFIILDLEASYLFLWAISLEEVGGIGYWGMVDFIVELTIGYIYLWRKGVLRNY